jgi:hypothetical protein
LLAVHARFNPKSQPYRSEYEQTTLGSLKRKRHRFGSHVQTSAGYVM